MQHNYLQSGKQTQITPNIQSLAKTFDTSDFSLVFELLEWLDQNLPQKRLAPTEKDRYFRKRTADEILTSGFSTGCTDSTLLFIALSRAKKIPTKYVELLSRKWLESDKQGPIMGHVVAEVKISNKWYFADPTHGTLSVKRPSGMVVYGKGLDSWDLGVTSENWREKFLGFRERWQEENKND